MTRKYDYLVERDNELDIAFNGKEIARVTSKKNESRRWTDIILYKTNQGAYVCQTLGVSIIDGERTKYDAEICETELDVINYLGTGWLAKELYKAACAAGINRFCSVHYLVG